MGRGGCSQLRWSADCVRSDSSTLIRCAHSLWTVSGRRPTPRPLGRRPRPAGLLASLSPPADRPGVPCLHRACRLHPAHLVTCRPLAAAAGATGSLRNPSGIPEEVSVWAALAYLAVSTLVPICHLRLADAGVCAMRSGGGASDSNTVPEYSPRPACDGGFATAGTPTQHDEYACGVSLRPLGHDWVCV